MTNEGCQGNIWIIVVWVYYTFWGVLAIKVGDRVVYPMHGAGIIESIEERNVLGECETYYIMKLPLGEMKVMIRFSQAEDIGLRSVIDEADACSVLDILKGEISAMPSNWSNRYRENMEKIKKGDIFEIAEVVRNLNQRDKTKGLSSGELKMLDTARQLLLSEMVLAKQIKIEQISELLQSILQ